MWPSLPEVQDRQQAHRYQGCRRTRLKNPQNSLGLFLSTRRRTRRHSSADAGACRKTPGRRRRRSRSGWCPAVASTTYSLSLRFLFIDIGSALIGVSVSLVRFPGPPKIYATVNPFNDHLAQNKEATGGFQGSFQVSPE